MGNQKQKWTAEEEEALQVGVQRYGAGKWKNILRDPELQPKLISRSNIDLKDKWRNLNVFPGQTANAKARATPKAKPSPSVVPVNATLSPSPVTVITAAATPSPATTPAPVNATTVHNVSPVPQTTQFQTQTPTRRPPQNDDDAKIPPKYNSMIFEALSTLKDTNGSDLSAIVSFIEQKHNLPQNPNFRKTLGSKLRRLVSQGKLDKVQNGYKLKDTAIETKPADDTKPPAPKEEMDPPVSINTSAYDDAMREAAETVAIRIAEAEHRSFLAAAAVKEAERYAKFDEENDAMLKFAEELLEKCKLGGNVRFA
ncbi:telomere repeat-binding factor 4-like [Trifolium pratense]|uniref:telomere repeat-binding factor 4-like n=1 Tax=Trifolium pratense TaxID=57577 RepID=UPI001E69137D|nr:telomere repeat-binding factor 4-like [Trifolium pratense]